MNGYYQAPYYQAPNSGGGGMITIIIVIVLLIALGVGGYFAYEKLLRPYQCNNKGEDITSNVATFMWDSTSSNCLASTCMAGYGTAATGGLPVSNTCPLHRTYSLLTGTGTCTDGSTTALTPASPALATKTDLACGSSCDALSGCLGYDWDSVSTSCNLYTITAPVKVLSTPITTACHNNPTAGT